MMYHQPVSRRQSNSLVHRARSTVPRLSCQNPSSAIASTAAGTVGGAVGIRA